MKMFTIEYQHEGRSYTAEIYARDFEDANRRKRAIYYTGEAQEIVARVGVPGWLKKLTGGV